MSMECLGVVFQGTGVEGPQSYVFNGQTIEGPAVPEHYTAQGPNWLRAYCLGLAFRSERVLNILVGYDAARIRSAPSGAYDRYLLSLIEGLRLFRLEDPAFATALDDAERLSRPENLEVASPSAIERYRALIPLALSIARRSQSEFDAAALKAVQAHRATYARGKAKTDPSGLLAYHAAGLIALGIDRGLTYNIESGYTPRWLVEKA
jgi:hypothetical protein